MAVNSRCSYNFLDFSFVSQLGCQVQVGEEEPGTCLLPRVSQTSVCDLTELLSGSAWFLRVAGPRIPALDGGMPGWLLGRMRGEPGMLVTGEESLIP